VNGYYDEQYGYLPTQYQPMVWQTIVAVMIDLIILVALGAWALSMMRKAFKGEEVELPL